MENLLAPFWPRVTPGAWRHNREPSLNDRFQKEKDRYRFLGLSKGLDFTNFPTDSRERQILPISAGSSLSETDTLLKQYLLFLPANRSIVPILRPSYIYIFIIPFCFTIKPQDLFPSLPFSRQTWTSSLHFQPSRKRVYDYGSFTDR